MDYTDSTDSMDSYFITDPDTYLKLLTTLLEQLTKEKKDLLPLELIVLLDAIRQHKTPKNAELIISYFLKNFHDYQKSTIDGIANFLDTSFFKACKTIYDQGLILNTSTQGDLNFIAVLTHKNICDLAPVLELLVHHGIIGGALAQKNFDLIIQHPHLNQFCSALIQEKISCLKHDVIRTHFKWIAQSQKPKYLIEILSLLNEAQLITKSNYELLSRTWYNDLKAYASLFNLLYQHQLLTLDEGKTNFIKVMARRAPIFFCIALHNLEGLFRSHIPQIILNMLLKHSDPVELSEAIEIIGRRSLIYKEINGRYAAEYVAQHPAPRELANALILLYQSKPINVEFQDENALTIINHPNPFYLTYNLYLIHRAGQLTDCNRQLTAQHQDDTQELFNILNILTRRKIIKATWTPSPPGLSPQELISELLAHQKIKMLDKCLSILYEAKLLDAPVRKTVFKALLQHPNLEYFSSILSSLLKHQLLPSPLPLPNGNHNFWLVAKHKKIQSLHQTISILNKADLLDQANLDVLLAHKKPTSLARALTSLDKLFGTLPLSRKKYPLTESTIEKKRQEAFTYLAGYPRLKYLSKILSKLIESALFNSLQGVANIKLVVNHPHRKILLSLLSQLTNKGVFHKKNTQCFFDAIIQHPNLIYLQEALSYLTSLKGINKLAIKDAFILAMKETGFTFSETKTTFSKNANILFYANSKPSSTGDEAYILVLRSGGY